MDATDAGKAAQRLDLAPLERSLRPLGGAAQVAEVAVEGDRGAIDGARNDRGQLAGERDQGCVVHERETVGDLPRSDVGGTELLLREQLEIAGSMAATELDRPSEEADRLLGRSGTQPVRERQVAVRPTLRQVVEQTFRPREPRPRDCPLATEARLVGQAQ